MFTAYVFGLPPITKVKIITEVIGTINYRFHRFHQEALRIPSHAWKECRSILSRMTASTVCAFDNARPVCHIDHAHNRAINMHGESFDRAAVQAHHMRLVYMPGLSIDPLVCLSLYWLTHCIWGGFGGEERKTVNQWMSLVNCRTDRRGYLSPLCFTFTFFKSDSEQLALCENAGDCACSSWSVRKPNWFKGEFFRCDRSM